MADQRFLFASVFLVQSVVLLASDALAHGGGLNAAGCHNDRKRGGYHCHRSGYTPTIPAAPLAPSGTAPRRGTSASSFADIPPPPSVSAWQQQESQKRIERAQYWKEQGHHFDPGYLSAYAMDQKVRDRERAKHWSSLGYGFNPEYMTAYAMDQKVKDIERARYWQSHGHHFNPEYMTAYAMDQKARDIARAKYWAERGYDFNPDYVSAYAMDREVERRRAQVISR